MRGKSRVLFRAGARGIFGGRGAEGLFEGILRGQ